MTEQNKQPQVKTEMILHYMTDVDRRNPLPTTFSYSKHDPYAVAMEIYRPPGLVPVKWLFSRELVAEACMTGEETGIGDVIFTSHTRAGKEYLGILLSAKTKASLEADKGEIDLFLAEAHKLVPPEDEFDLVDFDESVTKLLG